jgi:hypothetical protein
MWGNLLKNKKVINTLRARAKLSIILLSIFTISITSSVVAEEVVVGFCFRPSVSLDRVVFGLKDFLVAKDRVHKRPSQNCIDVETTKIREDLINKVVRSKFSVVQSFSSGRGNNVVKENCKIDVVSTGRSNTNTFSVNAGRKTNVQKSETQAQGKSTSKLLLGAGRSGRISIDGEVVSIKCLPLGGDRFEIEVFIQSKFKNSQISTSVSVVRNQPLDLGQLVEELNQKDRNLSINSGIQYKKSKGTSTKDYQLILR